MNIINESFSWDQNQEIKKAWKAIALFNQVDVSDFVIFDIETTGLSANVSSVYLIGALWYDSEEKQCKMRQWFADDYISEETMLQSFSDFLSPFSTIVHYNGTGFDIPYLEKKYKQFHLISPFPSLHSFDIYGILRKEKELFACTSLKLSAVEKLTGFIRRDSYSGKECIQIYSDFMQKKIFQNHQARKEMEKLLLHNSDDLWGTLRSGLLLYYKLPLSFERLVFQEDRVQVFYETKDSTPFPCSLEKEDYQLSFDSNHACITLLVKKETGFHFYDSYRDYYYLPKEDMAIHKSVGIYVEKEFREPAKASNCYMKKTDFFLHFPAGTTDYLQERGLVLFRESYRSKTVLILLSELKKQDSLFWEEVLPYITSA